MPPLNLVGDYGGGGMLLALGLLSGILEARQSGAGQVVDVAMVDGVATLMAVFYGLLAEGRWGDRRSATSSTARPTTTAPTRPPTASTSRSGPWSRSSTPSSANGSTSTCPRGTPPSSGRRTRR